MNVLENRLQAAEGSENKPLAVQRILWNMVQAQALEENNQEVFDKADGRLEVIRLLELSETFYP